MSLHKDHPEKGRKSSGAAWTRNGQAKRLQKLDQPELKLVGEAPKEIKHVPGSVAEFLETIEIDGDRHTPEVWARVEGFLAGWEVCHSEFKPYRPSWFVFQRERLEETLLPRPQIIAQSAPQHTTLRHRAGVRLYDWTFKRWTPRSLILTDHLGQERELTYEMYWRAVLAGDLLVSGSRPDWAKFPARPAARPVPKPAPTRRSGESFMASRYHGVYGQIKFAGDYRKWMWVMKHCCCAECGASVGTHPSDEAAPGYLGAKFFTCNSADRHVIKGETDLRWREDVPGAPEEFGEVGTVDEVLDGLPHLNAQSDIPDLPV